MSDVRLIDAVALEKLFEEECAGECPICSYSHEGCPCGFIRTVPTVEAYTKDDMTNEYLKGYNACKDIIQPTGKWVKVVENTPMYDKEGIETWGAIYQCPKCGFCHNVIEDRTLYKYCPNCGAIMKGE